MSEFSGGAESSALCAFVTYVPEPMGPYLDRVRQRIAPWMPPGRSHATVLAPRPIPREPEAIWANWRAQATRFPAFEIELASVEVFEETDVVYMAISGGSRQLSEMHHLMNADGASHPEPFPFHPHITLALGLSKDRARAAVREAEAMWAEFQDSRSFAATRFHIVRNETGDGWRDVEVIELL